MVIQELAPAEVARVRPLFEGWAYALDVASVFDGNTPARVFVDCAAAPRTALVWVVDMFFLAGDETNAAFRDGFDRLLEATVAPAAAQRGLGYFSVQVYPLDRWEPVIRAWLQARDAQVNYEWHSRLNPERYRALPPCPPLAPGMSLQPVDRALLSEPEGVVVGSEVQRAWVSLDRFLEKGLGVCARVGSRVVSYCLSLRYSGGAHEIGVNTYDPEYRNCGLATRAARAFIDACLARGETPVWTTDLTNAPSLRVAQKLGFEKVGEYPDYYFGF